MKSHIGDKKKENIISTKYKKLFKKKYGKICKIESCYVSESFYTLALKFKNLTNILFGIWKWRGLDGNVYYDYFAEHVAFIDKFKPTATHYTFHTIDEMVEFANKMTSLSDDDFHSEIAKDYHYDSINELKHDISKQLQRDKHNGLTNDEVSEDNKFIIEISKQYPHLLFIFCKSIFFQTLYEVYIYNGVSDEEYDEVEKLLVNHHVNVNWAYPTDQHLKTYSKKYFYVKNGEIV